MPSFLLFSSVVHAAASVAVKLLESNSRVKPDGGTAELRPSSFEPNGINFQDCVEDLALQYSLILTETSPTYRLQVWAGGADCVDKLARTSTSNPTCWPVMDRDLTQTTPQTIRIRMRDLIGYIGNIQAVKTTYVHMGEDVCSRPVRKQRIQLFFLLVDNSSYEVVNAVDFPSETKSIPVSLAGPEPLQVDVDHIQTGLTVKIPFAEFSSSREDIQGVAAYCAKTNPGDCSNVVFIDPGSPLGKFQKADPKWECARTLGSVMSSITIRNLELGQPYVVSLAGIDSLGNMGSLTEGICVTPVQTKDFFTVYKEQGGQAGGQCAAVYPGSTVRSAVQGIGWMGMIWLARRWMNCRRLP
ncbi:hypothetical protein [Pajaroellobacter abortibovis]|nr:hypothetical protein [Pajaroellobacter abortibovis]